MIDRFWKKVVIIIEFLFVKVWQMTVGALISSYQKKCVRARVVLMTSHRIDYNDDMSEQIPPTAN